MDKSDDRKNKSETSVGNTPNKILANPAEGNLHQHNTIDKKDDSGDAEDKHKPSEVSMGFIKRWWGFVKDPQHSGAVVAIFTIVIAITGILYTTVSVLQWCANNKAADAAKSAADTARKQLEMMRPWLTSEFVPTGLMFKEDGGFLGLNITIANTGNSVAKSITAWTELWIDTRTLLSEGSRYCEIPKNAQNKDFQGGAILFPGQHYTFYQPAAATTEIIEKALKSGDFKDQQMVTIYVITCIDYRSTLDTEHHQTRSYFSLSRPDFVRHTMMGIFDPHGIYAPSQFTLGTAGSGYGSVD